MNTPVSGVATVLTAGGFSVIRKSANRYLETFLVNSWAEHLRQHERQTQSDEALEQRIRTCIATEPKVHHLIYAYSRET